MATASPKSQLITAVKDGRVADLAQGALPADIFRELLYSPVRGSSATTPAGILIANAVIHGRIVLDDAANVDGAGIVPIEMRNCTLQGGFCGRHGRFTRLSFDGCKFKSADVTEPSIDLSGAEIGTDLELTHMKATAESGFLWIKAASARIDGSLILDGTRLRAPDDSDALDMTLSEIRGDLFFDDHFEAAGRIKGRGLQVDGDVWFRGATIDGRGGESLFLQSARIGGVAVFEGKAGSGGDRPFTSRGEINLHQLRLGGRFYIAEACITGSTDAASGRRLALCLESATIAGATIGMGGTLAQIEGEIQLGHLEVAKELVILRARLGVAAATTQHGSTIAAHNLSARKLKMIAVKPLQCAGANDFDPKLHMLSIDLSDATLGKLEIEDCRLNGHLTATALACTGDVRLRARIDAQLDLEGANIGGSLDISRLRMGPNAKLSLKDGNIARALRLAHARERDEPQPVRLEAARETLLSCLPDASLVETLWRYESESGSTMFRQHAFLQRHDVIRALDRRSDALGRFARAYGHSVHDEQAAAEFVRLYCAYGPSDSGARWLLPSKTSLPHFLEFSSGAQRKTRSASDLPSRFFAFGAVPASPCTDELFAFEACVLIDNRFGRGRIAVRPATDRPSLSFQPLGSWRDAVGAPASEGRFAMHPPDRQPIQPIWVTPPALDRSVEASAAKLHAIDKRLRPHLRSDFSMEAGMIDLSDLSCDTLDDQGGRFWGRQRRIEMNHFVYRQATWEAPDEEAPKTMERFQRMLSRFKAERVPTWLIGRSEAERLRERTDIWSPWQLRRNWIYQQFSGAPTLLSPARHRVKWREYRPQPFDQAARVARSEGRDEFAIQFEILRRRIDWDLFERRARWTLGILGIMIASLFLIARDGSRSFALVAVGCLIVIALMLGWRLAKGQPWWFRRLIYGFFFAVPVTCVFFFGEWDLRPLDFAIAAIIFTVIRFAAKLSDIGMRWMFGYLRRPVNAIFALSLAFLVGWLGVAVANRTAMLVIDTTPVATAAGAEKSGEDERLVMVAPGAVERPFAHNVPCAETISEPLYALDVLIPLLDLRQESRCEVAQVHEDHIAAQAVAATAAPGSRADSPRGGVVTRLRAAWDVLVLQVGLLPQKESFWLGLKALYAIAGWVLVSLSILTFANINPARSESG